MTLSVIFLGTPEFAVPALQALLDAPEISVLGVMTQPDRPSGRGQKLTPPPVKQLALTHQLDVRQPTRLRKEPDMIDWLHDLAPDYLVTAAFGQILPQEVLDIPRLGTVNVHASLLPAYRGANPIQAAIIHGEKQAGVTTMFTVLEVDAGPMLQSAALDIAPDETAAELTDRLARLGAGILVDSLQGYANGTLVARAQDVALATHAPKGTKQDAAIDWTQSAEAIHNRIRGQQPWPGAVTSFGGQTVKLLHSKHPATTDLHHHTGGAPGDIRHIGADGVVIQTGSAPLLLTRLQPPGKPGMAARDWANGALRDVRNPRFEQAVIPA